MKPIANTIMALIFVFITLISLVTLSRSSNDSFMPQGDNQGRISELGLRFAFQR
jgi:hypothetical protein